ncbi:hypothetical protein BKA64DRAFT_647412 [Cadophora sp. MPI-SDFR-AT-0126]|nr:hypothetical protein BKA64DRAFT_647412 [Leotiomycetes sp. MPI-SDFR-AT-0126]
MLDMEQIAGWECCRCQYVNKYDWFTPSTKGETRWREQNPEQPHYEPSCRGANCPRQRRNGTYTPHHVRCGKCLYVDSGSQPLDHCNDKDNKGYDSESPHPDNELGPEAQQEGQQTDGERSGTRQQSQQGSTSGQRRQASGATGRNHRSHSSASRTTDTGRGSKDKVPSSGRSSDASKITIKASRNDKSREKPKSGSSNSEKTSGSSSNETRHHESIGESKDSQKRSLLSRSSGKAPRTGTASRSTVAPKASKSRSTGGKGASESSSKTESHRMFSRNEHHEGVEQQ